MGKMFSIMIPMVFCVCNWFYVFNDIIKIPFSEKKNL